MFDTLKDLNFGNIAPSEKAGTQNPRFKSCIREVSDSRDALTLTLSDSQKELLELYEEKSDTLSAISVEDAFIRGFGLAVKLITEGLASE